MLTSELRGLRQLLRICLPFVVTTTLYTVVFLRVEETLGDRLFSLPGQMGSVFGLAVAFFLGFRMNAAYDRWWEARKIFGELTNTTRSFVVKVVAFYGSVDGGDASDGEARRQVARDLIDLTCWYVRRLREEMHGVARPEMRDERRALAEQFGIDLQHKVTHEILLAMTRCVQDTFPGGDIDKTDLMAHVTRFFDAQGKAERIRNTPFLPIYRAFTRIVVSFYVLLLPLFIGDIDLGGEASRFEVVAIPLLVIISTAFLTINELANLFGEPFSEHSTSVPIDDICGTIVANCLEVRSKLEGVDVEVTAPTSA